MAEDNSVFDEVEDRTKSPGFGGGDYADWWEPDGDHGEHLVGVIVETHSAPEDWTEPGEVPDTMYTVRSLGRGDHAEGTMLTPKNHKQLKNGLRTAGVGDLVNVRFTGYEKVNGNMMMTYEVGTVPQDEWEEMGGADEIRAALDDQEASGGAWGDNTRDEPYTTSSSSSGSEPDASSGLSEAADYLKDLVEIQNGDMDVAKADKMLNDVNGYDVDVEATAIEAGLSVEDGAVRLN